MSGVLGRFLVAILCLLFVGCGPPHRGSVTAEGYSHRAYRYRVVSLENGHLMPENWKFDNYYQKDGRLTVKDSPDYVIEYELDGDGDGDFELKAREHRYDLKFDHLVHDGTVLVRTIPISADLAHKKLSVLMDRYVEGIAKAGYELVQFAPGRTVMLERRYAAAVVEEVPAKLAGLDALVVTLDVANLDQVKVDPSARAERVRLVLAHTPFRYKRRQKTQEENAEFPVVMLVAYGNQPEEFDAGLPDFEHFLERIEIASERGFSMDRPTKPPAEEGVDEPPAATPEDPAESADAPSGTPGADDPDGTVPAPTE